MKNNRRNKMLMDLNKRLTADIYDTPKETKRIFWDRLFFNSRVYFIYRYIKMILRMSFKAKRGKFEYDEFMELGFSTFKILEDVGAKFHIEGVDNLKKVKNEPVVFVGNHMSTLETMILTGIIMPIKNTIFVAKKSLLTFPVFGHIMKATKPISVGRVNPREDLKTVMEEGVKLLKEGTSIIIFQQSHRNAKFEPEKFSSLGIKLAQKAGVKVVPFALKTDFWGNAKKIRDFGPIRRKERVSFSFANPISVENLGKETNNYVIQFIQGKLMEWNHHPPQNSL